MDDETREPGAAEPPRSAEPPSAEPPPAVSWERPQPQGDARGAIPGWGAPVAWEAPDEGPRGGTFDVGSVFGRTLGTFAAWWPLYLALALPTAAISVVVAASGFESFQTGPVAILSLVSAVLSIYLTLAMIAVTDDVRSGRRPDLGTALRRAAGRFLHALGAALLAILAFALVLIIPIALAAATPVLAAVLFLVLFGVVFYLIGRWALVFPAVVLDELGPVDGLRRSWHVTKRNMWRLVALFIFIGLLTGPLSFALSFLALAGDRTWVPLAGIAAVLTTPLTPIALALMHGDITNRARDPIRAASGRGRMVLAVLIVGLGIALLVPAGLSLGPTFERIIRESATAGIPADQRGQLVVGLSRGSDDSCRPEQLTAVAGSSDPIYLGGYLDRAIVPGETILFDLYIDDELVSSEPLEIPQISLCYFEGPIQGLDPARYRFVIRDGDDVLAEGFLTIV